MQFCALSCEHRLGVPCHAALEPGVMTTGLVRSLHVCLKIPFRLKLQLG